MSVANQKTLNIVRNDRGYEFLQIEKDDWQAAAAQLTYSTFKVYLLLAGNKDGYKFEYSPQAIANTGLMSKSTATKARQELEEHGYIKDGNFYVHLE